MRTISIRNFRGEIVKLEILAGTNVTIVVEVVAESVVLLIEI